MNGSLIFVLFLAVAGGVLWAGWALEKKRREALQSLSGRLGFSFQAGAGMEALGSARGLRLFSLGHSQKISNLLQRHDGESRRAVFDYKYTTGSGKSRHSHRMTVCLLEKPGMLLPRFSLRPENVFHKIGSAVGYQDIDFGSNPVFSRQYLLQGDNEMAIRSLFNPALLAFFEQNPGWQAEGAGTALTICRPSDLVPAPQLADFIAHAGRLSALFS